jgi:magnesium-transporting ATPase (P-type)
MRSGLYSSVFSSDSYSTSYNKYHVYSRHITFVYNVFVFMQVFNFFNCRKINDEINIIKGVLTNYIFCGIVMLIVLLQWVIIYFLDKPFKLYNFRGLSLQQWFISLLIAFIVIPFSTILRMLPAGKPI